MNTTTQARATGERISGFTILETIDLLEFKAKGIWARHERSGLEVFHVLNDDRENLFAFAFATAPEDSSGVAHILEHSVLCGSEHYPLKDAFLVLAQGSLQTYLNAWTFPDKTVYPASSVSETDYFNLMSVYADAVFHPLLSEWTFMQEGHRTEFAAPQGDSGKAVGLSITGVVYNEMKGAYSSQDMYAESWSAKAVLPNTPYVFDSGGDPECIPDLTWADLKAFHEERYAPANCRVFLAGNIPTEKQLAFLNERILANLAPGTTAAPVARTKPWKEPRSIKVPCPTGVEQKATVFLSWLCGEATDNDEQIAIVALADVLLGHDGSPLTRVLVESDLGEDLSPVTGLNGELRELVLSIGLRGVQTSTDPKDVEVLILGELRRLCDEGIPKEEIEAALMSLEFSSREIRRSGGPWSLVWLRRSLRAWLHGGKPWDSLCFVSPFTELKKRIAADSRYFESLIENLLLNNPHRALVVVEPEADFLEKKDAALAERLNQTLSRLSETEKHDIERKARDLARIQGEADAPAVLASIPHLSRKDLSPDLERIPRAILSAGSVPLLSHELFTNGVTYVDLAFPIDILEPEDYPYLRLFADISLGLGLPNLDYGEVSSLLACTVGALYGSLQTGSSAPGAAHTVALPSGILDIVGRDWFTIRLKTLDEKLMPSLSLLSRIVREADFSDLDRIHDIVLEIKNDIDSSLAPHGHSYAANRASRGFSRSRALIELWSGFSQIEFIHQVAGLDDAELSRTFVRIRDKILSRSGLFINLTCSSETLPAAIQGISEHFGAFSPPRARNPLTASAFTPSAPTESEVYVSPSLQVGFAAQSLPAAPFATPEQTAELLLAHELSTGALWEQIRMKGGAYGANAFPDPLERLFSLSTYRDPNPLRSLEAFPAILQEMAKAESDEDFLEKAIIATYGRETCPHTSAEKGSADFLRFLYGIDEQRRVRRLRDLIATTVPAINAAAVRLAAAASGASAVVLAGPVLAEQAAASLGVEVKPLPV
ncbi:MAG: insulinase family protein [Treponema sp.]|jgi:Zn-dependent M16 (insulinase) family peptidase|nr:insulinase family protein [Treponema sp.]